MEKIFAKVEELTDNVKQYIDTRLDLAKLSAAEKSSDLIARAVAAVIISVIILFILAFASIALSLYLGDWLGKEWEGFLMVAGLYILAAFIVWLLKDRLIRLPILNAIIQQLFKTEDDEED